jgi:hypothetical protein
MQPWRQPAEKPQTRVHNPVTAEEKVCLLNYADSNPKVMKMSDAKIVRFVTTDGL